MLAELGQGQRPVLVDAGEHLQGPVAEAALGALGAEPAALLGRGQHGTTFGGNPVAAAAALAVLTELESGDLLEQVTTVGHQLRTEIIEYANPLVSEVRGTGLLIGVELREPIAAKVADAALDLGLIVNPVTPTTIRLAPPLVLTSDQASEMARLLDTAIRFP